MFHNFVWLRHWDLKRWLFKFYYVQTIALTRSFSFSFTSCEIALIKVTESWQSINLPSRGKERVWCVQLGRAWWPAVSFLRENESLVIAIWCANRQSYFVGNWVALVDGVRLVHIGFLSQEDRISVATTVVMLIGCALNHRGCMMIRTPMVSTADISDV